MILFFSVISAMIALAYRLSLGLDRPEQISKY
jgi:hypothetical protein